MRNCAEKEFNDAEFFLTLHAQERMSHRHISAIDIENVISYGRRAYTRGAVIYVVGAKEVKLQRTFGVNLERCEGVHVVCTNDNSILTVYRNRDLRGLKPKSRKHWSCNAKSERHFLQLDAA